MPGSHSRPERRLDRRQFLTSAGSLAAAATATAYFPWANSAFANLSANDRPRIGCIGVGGLGRGDAHEHKHFGDILAICDVDKEHADKERRFSDRQQRTPDRSSINFIPNPHEQPRCGAP